ncbi:MAG: tetratricopeptide repeat protein [Nitrosomonadales bacterium]|nr:tetratricopeptide repeat protein [Nitrosomonadales bacterium]
MSLLLDAQKKLHQAQGGDGSRSGVELSLEEHSDAAASPSASTSNAPSSSAPLSNEKARVAGQNLFNAKSSAASPGFAGINKNLLFALGGTVLLLTAGGGYVWYVTSASNQPLRPVVRAPAATPVKQQAPVIAEATPKVVEAPKIIAEATPKNTLAPEVVSPKPASTKQPIRAARPVARKTPQQTRSASPMHIEQHQSLSIDPLLNSAYLAYREGKFDQAQQLYRDALTLDERNTDALLGLAVIAQRRGSDSVAAHYYAKVLELNPRDPVANAGMSALTTNDNVESRLKILLNEQQDSSALHFALGNHYAAQERWGEAQQSYFNAYKLEPKNAGLAFNLAISLERLGQKKLAAQYYQSALQLDPSHSEGFDHAQISQRIEELTGTARSHP